MSDYVYILSLILYHIMQASLNHSYLVCGVDDLGRWIGVSHSCTMLLDHLYLGVRIPPGHTLPFFQDV